MPKHFSVSSMKTYRECPKKFQLERIVDTPETPAWWFVSGSAFHAATEHVDKAMPTYSGSTAKSLDLQEIWTEAFNDEVYERLASEPDMDKWTGRSRSKTPPTGEQYYKSEYETGLRWLVEYVDWRSANPDLVITHVEEELFLPMEGSPIPLKGFVDRIAIRESSDELVLYDLKSGSTIEKNPLQLGTYRVGIQKKLGLDIKKGYYYQTKYNKFMDEFDLTPWTETLVSTHAREWHGDVAEGKFLPHITDGCFRCSMREYCYLKSGDTPLTRLDPLNPRYEGTN